MITVDFQNLRMTSAGRILDIGCGSGRHTAAAYDLAKGIVIGADPDFGDLQAACSRLDFHGQWQPHHQSGWALAGADITRLPFGGDIFDIVICSEVLEHIPDHGRAVAECVRVLKPGGELVVSVPRRWPETVCWALSKSYRHSPGGHIRIYSTSRLIRLIRSFGLEFVRIHYAHGLHSPYWWLKCFLGLGRPHIWPLPAYDRFLTWEMMRKPRWTRRLEHLLNPFLGKSTVLYFHRPA